MAARSLALLSFNAIYGNSLSILQYINKQIREIGDFSDVSNLSNTSYRGVLRVSARAPGSVPRCYTCPTAEMCCWIMTNLHIQTYEGGRGPSMILRDGNLLTIVRQLSL